MGEHSPSRYSRSEELAHTVTQGIGLLLSTMGLSALLVLAVLRGNHWHVVGCAVFGTSMVLLYAASTFYHGVRAPNLKRILRRLDHSAIFLLIAGTYTSFLILGQGGPKSGTLLGLVWAAAVVGIALENLRPEASRVQVLPLYLIMGWAALVVAEPLARFLGSGGIALLVGGGVAYTVGVIFYTWRSLAYHHAVWHLFVLAGSSLHFACVVGFVIPPGA